MIVACLLLVALLHAHHYRLIVTGPRGDLLGLTDTSKHTVTLFVHEGEPKALKRKVLAYETAHVLDVSCLTAAQRSSWQRLRHVHGGWYAPDYASESGYGSGDFADVYSAWAEGPAYAQGRLPRQRDMRSLASRFHFQRGVCR